MYGAKLRVEQSDGMIRRCIGLLRFSGKMNQRCRALASSILGTYDQRCRVDFVDSGARSNGP
jgi:hypothetical protein